MFAESPSDRSGVLPPGQKNLRKRIRSVLMILFIAGVGCNFPLLQPRPTPPTLLPTQVVESPVILTPTFLPEPTATAETPAALPAGKIVYVCFIDQIDQICIMNGDGSDRQQLTDTESTSFYPSLSPDGNRIVFSSRRDGNFEIYEMDISGNDLTRLTNDIGSLYAPEISPDGSTIIFTNDVGGKQHIWVMERDGGFPHPITEGEFNDLDPTWSPDGSLIAFASDRTGSTQIFTVRPDGTDVRQVTLDIRDIGGRNTWSPDGRTIAYYAGTREDSSRELYLVDPADHTVRQITDGGDNLGPSFSPDGQWLAFTSFRTGNNDIWIIRVDGSQPVQLTDDLRSDWQPRWGP